MEENQWVDVSEKLPCDVFKAVSHEDIYEVKDADGNTCPAWFGTLSRAWYSSPEWFRAPRQINDVVAWRPYAVTALAKLEEE